jgi:hypothetical protein
MFHTMQTAFFVTLDILIISTLIYKTAQMIREYKEVK